MSFSVSFDRAVSPDVASCGMATDPAVGQSYENLVMEACGHLSEARGGRFCVSGFGEDAWPVDVAYDLSAFMEQYPSVLAGVRERREVEVDLYSQGIERTLTFFPDGVLVTIRCRSRTSWQPIPDRESISQVDLNEMLSKLAFDFASALKEVNSNLSNIDPFKNWLAGQV
ncbi:hypothetical protein [Amycolatopsis albispora]|uniref:hypothetical protein n=1 Tax=Amycolatopsis albispora TaxID=1804986 RepID=UPI0013B3692C|nr:hypothetical protein [Amycolatopsis albispora]